MSVDITRLIPTPPPKPPVIKVEASCNYVPTDTIIAQEASDSSVEVMVTEQSSRNALSVILTPEDTIAFATAMIELASQQMKKGK